MTESEKYEALEGFLEKLGGKQSVKVKQVQKFSESHGRDICSEDILDYLAANGITVIGLQRNETPRSYHKDDPLWLYIKEVGKVNILGKERELEVASRLQQSLYSIRSLLPENTMLIARLIHFRKMIASHELPLDEFIKATSGDPNATTEEKRVTALELLDEIAEGYEEIIEYRGKHRRGELSDEEYEKGIAQLSGQIREDIERLELTARALERFNDLIEKIARYAKTIGQRFDDAAVVVDISPELFRKRIEQLANGDVTIERVADEFEISSSIIHEALFLLRREKRVRQRLEDSCLIPLDEFVAEIDGLPEHWATYEECKRLLIEANVRLVINIAKNYTNQGVDFLDLIQEGNAALIKAVERFDPARGYKLGTYAIWWIRQAMLRTLAEQSHVVKLPTYLVQWVRRYSKISQELSQKLGRKPTPQEVSAGMEVEPEKSSKMRRFFTSQVSLNKSLGNDDSRTLEDVIADDSGNTPFNVADLTMLQAELKRVLGTLTTKEQRVISLRFGLEDNVPRTLEEIGHIFDLSRERIRQIEMKALSKLRHPSKLEKLLPYFKE